MTTPDPSNPTFSPDDCERLAAANLFQCLRRDEPGGAIEYIKVLGWLKSEAQPVAASPEHATPALPPEQAAEAIFTLAAQLAFALLEAPETAPAAFTGLVEAWRAQHLAPGEAIGGMEAARAALRRYLDLSEADAARASELREA